MRKNKPVSPRRSSFSLAAMLVGICLSFLGIIFISVIYIAKDYYAYNSVYAFFGIDSQTLLWLMGLPVGQKTLLRLLESLPRLFYRLLGDVRDVVFVAAAGAGGPVSGLADWRDMAGAGRVSGSPISQLALHGTDRSL